MMSKCCNSQHDTTWGMWCRAQAAACWDILRPAENIGGEPLSIIWKQRRLTHLKIKVKFCWKISSRPACCATWQSYCRMAHSLLQHPLSQELGCVAGSTAIVDTYTNGKL